MQSPVPLRDYSDSYEAEKDAELLEAHGIACLVKHEYETFNPAFTLKASLNAVHLLVDPASHGDAARVLDLRRTRAPSMESVLATWSDEELMAVAARPDEWHAGTVAAAEILLDRRGVRLTDETGAENARRRATVTRSGQHGDPVWLTVGLLLAVAGGLGGILMGLGYRLLTQTDADGTTFPVYDRRTRGIGNWMVGLGTVSAVVWFWSAIFV